MSPVHRHVQFVQTVTYFSFSSLVLQALARFLLVDFFEKKGYSTKKLFKSITYNERSILVKAGRISPFFQEKVYAPSPSGFLCFFDKQPVFPYVSFSSRSSALPSYPLDGHSHATPSYSADDAAGCGSYNLSAWGYSYL